VPVGGEPYHGFTVGDIDGDGLIDLATSNENGVGVVLNSSTRDVAFGRPSVIDAVSPLAVGLGDLSGDGQLNLVSASESGPQIEEDAKFQAAMRLHGILSESDASRLVESVMNSILAQTREELTLQPCRKSPPIADC
jgi:hypothetical protein